MKLQISLYFFLFQIFLPHVHSESSTLSVERTRAIAAIFSLIQCFPNSTTELPPDIQAIIQTNQNFNPEAHLSEYANLTEIQNLLTFVNQQQSAGIPDTTPFLNDPISIANFQLIFIVLWRNADNWPLFYQTTAWLLNRVNTAMLFWCLNIISGEKFSDTVTVPSTASVFPQLYLPKDAVLSVAGIQSKKRSISPNPLQYWMSDPGLNEFHTHFHMDMPFWWDPNIYGIYLDRKGELFLYMHHNIVNRYNAERLSNGLPDVTPLGLVSDYKIPDGYQPNIVNVDFDEFPPRPDEWRIGSFEVANITLANLKRMYDRMSEGIDLGYFIDTSGNHIPLQGEKGTDVLGATVESSNVYSADFNYYGSFHNEMHQYLSGALTKKTPVPGVEAHQETAMHDRVFFQIHKSVDDLYLKFKNLHAAPYTKEDLEFSGIAILDLKIITRPKNSQDMKFANTNLTWPFPSQQAPEKPVLTTYMRTETFDISNAARPCRSVNSEPTLAKVTTLNHVPFTYVIAVQSMRPQVAYGMVRIFLWPEVTLNGSRLEGDEAHVRAIELDRFRVRLNPMGVNIIQRSSLNSTITRVEPSPEIKDLYRVEAGSGLLTRPEIRRACAFPNNMLIPKGTKEGLPFKLTVYISDETDAGDVEDNQFPHYPYCGVLKGLPFPDKRPMGFPFDRRGTSFNVTASSKVPITAVFGCSNLLMTNVRQMSLLIKHDDESI